MERPEAILLEAADGQSTDRFLVTTFSSLHFQGRPCGQQHDGNRGIGLTVLGRSQSIGYLPIDAEAAIT
jgi:hypothetical protein